MMTDHDKTKNEATPEKPETTKPARRLSALPTGLFVQLIILLGVGGIAYGMISGAFDGFGRWVSELVNRPASFDVQDAPTVVRSVRPLGELVSVRAQLAKAGINVSLQYGIAGGICRITAKHVAQGTIEAGIDLRDLNADRLTYDAETDTYTVRLPQPRLTNCIIDPFQTEQYVVEGVTPFCPADEEELKTFATYLALIGFRNDAIEGGLLTEAQAQAETVLGSFIENLTGRRVQIVFDEGEPALPASCTPNPPGGWQYNPQTGLWNRP